MNQNVTVGEYLDLLIGDVNGIILESRNVFGELTEDQFNWKANQGEWSVAQCLEHMRMNLISFIPVFDRKFRDHTHGNIDLEQPYKHGFIGKRAIRIIGPESTRRFKTTKNMDPQQSNYDLSAVDDFIEYQNLLKEYVDKAKGVNIKSVRVAFPGFGILKLSMGDTLKFIIEHEKRHVKQAKNVMQMTGFPVTQV